MSVIKFPGNLPSPHQLDLPRAQISVLLEELTKELTTCKLDVMTADSAGALAAAIRKTAHLVSHSSKGWAEISSAIKESWGV